MSRQPPYTSSSTPRKANASDPYSSSATRPLYINRPVRSTTPSNNVSQAPFPPATPSRPDRSAYRPRQPSEYSLSDAVSVSRPSDGRERRDSASTTRSDASGQYGYRNGSSSASTAASRPPRRANRSRTTNTLSSDEVDSPAALSAVMSAFQSAGARKKTLEFDRDEERERERQEALDAEMRRQRKIQERAPGRKAMGRTKEGDIDAVLDKIKDEWEFVIDPDFNPVDLALHILDGASSGKDMSSFKRTKKMLSQALKGSVDKHYQAFAAALPHHASLVAHLNVAQTHVKNSRSVLQEAKDTLGNKRSDLVQLWTRGQTLEEMLRILDKLERIKLVPDMLESLISEKRFLQAATILEQSLKVISKQDMLDIGALADLRSYLNSQKSALGDILIDEIHGHLYLKSFWCESRWAPYHPDNQSLPNVVPRASLSGAADIAPNARTPLTQYLHELALRQNEPLDDLVDPGLHDSLSKPSLASGSSNENRGLIIATSTISTHTTHYLSQPPTHSDENPESDSFSYLEMLLESLAVLGKLSSALDTISQRLPNEVYSLIETTVDEVGERVEYNQKSSMLSSGTAANVHMAYFISSTSHSSGDISDLSLETTKHHGDLPADAFRLRFTALEYSAKQNDHEVLRDLFWTAYSKLDAVLQGLRVIYEVADRIGSRRDFKDFSNSKLGSLFPLAEMWLPIQVEIRTLLYDYVAGSSQGAISGRNRISSISDVLREGRNNRDKSKHVFKFVDTDAKASSKLLRPHEEELDRALRDTVPGLVQGPSETSVHSILSSVGTDERLLGFEQHHRLLLKPDAAHVSVLFKPTLAFLERVALILPSGLESARSSRIVLEEFVKDVYLPQLEETVSTFFHQIINGPDAFQSDPASSWLSARPLINASTQIVALINSLIVMLNESPFQRDSYARFILTVIIQFYQRCSDHYQALVTSGGLMDAATRIALAAQWAQNSELSECLLHLYDTPVDALAARRELQLQERSLEKDLLGENDIEKLDLVHPLRNLEALGHLYSSLTWFITALNQLQSVPDDEDYLNSPIPTDTSVMQVPPYQRGLVAMSSKDGLPLPLSREMSMRFQALLKTYEQLSEFILYTIRLDIRCRIIYYMELASRHGNYSPDREVGEPDPHIIDLNMELSAYDEIISSTLSETEQQFVFDGADFLIGELLISTARNIRKLNDNGARKISRNILALQQGVRTVTRAVNDNSFERAKQYWSLYALGPTGMLEAIHQEQIFTLDEYKTMLDLQCGIDPVLGDKSSQTRDRNYSMYVIDLHGLDMERQGDTAK